MGETQRIQVSRTIDAPVERVFALLADPDQHTRVDGTGSLRGSRTHAVLTGLGEVFSMDMYFEPLGDYVTDNVVSSYRRDREIGWSPGARGEGPLGHTYTFTLEPHGDDRTVVTQTYDWSAVTDERVLPHLPFATGEQLSDSLDRLAGALEEPKLGSL